MWTRRQYSTQTCPKSLISGQSRTWLEEYSVWKMFGHGDLWSMPARTVEAFCLLERELMREKEHANR